MRAQPTTTAAAHGTQRQRAGTSGAATVARANATAVWVDV